MAKVLKKKISIQVSELEDANQLSAILTKNDYNILVEPVYKRDGQAKPDYFDISIMTPEEIRTVRNDSYDEDDEYGEYWRR